MATSLSLLDSQFRPWAEALVDVAKRYGLRPRVTSTYRSLREQQSLYDRWLRGANPYPVARPGRSLHQYGLAIDMVCDDPDWLGAVWRAWGGQWSPSDAVHFGAY